jgi:hypothetical protein
MDKFIRNKNAGTHFVSIITCLMIIYSCYQPSKDSCRWEREYYSEKWDYVVKNIYRYENYNATWVIQTTSGKEIFIRPNQPVISIANSGDKLIKSKNSATTLIIKININGNDTLKSRIYSPSCDKVIMQKKEKRNFEY